MNHGCTIMTWEQSSSLHNGRRRPLHDWKNTPSLQQHEVHADHFFDIRGIVHKEFVPPSQTVNGNFYCEVLRWMRENVRQKRPEMWKNRDWLLHHDNAPAHTSLLVREFLTWPLFPTLPTHLTWPPAISTCSLKWNSSWKGSTLYPLKRSKQNHNRY